MKKPRPVKPGKGEESVWDYPRPPAIESFSGSVEVYSEQGLLAGTSQCFRVLETSHPPVFYLPWESANHDYLTPSNHQSFCEWKGMALYLDLHLRSGIVKNVAWYYPNPNERYSNLKNHLSFYPSKVDSCYVNGEKVKAQKGDFYGGWITSNIVGPFKGETGTWGW